MLTALLVLVLLLSVGTVAVGWYFSSQFLTPAPYALMPEFEVTASEAGRVTLPAPTPQPPQFARTRVEGVYNLLWEHGYGRLGPVLADDGAHVTRELAVVAGRSPVAGDPARVDITIYRRDPLRDHGIPFEDLRLEGETGALAAWWIEGGDDAVLMLHGRRRADRSETLRVLPAIVEMGHSVLVLSWRNHDASAPSPDGLYRYGATEYRDALTGLAFLADRGIERVVLYGFSTGATIGLEAARRWPTGAPELTGIVIDSPLVDIAASVRASGRAMGLPGFLSEVALAVGWARTGVRWSELDQRRHAAGFEAPFLIFAGTADGTIPVQVVDDFVARLHAPSTYVRLEGVQHVEGWNADPGAYTASVTAFLSEALGSREAPAR